MKCNQGHGGIYKEYNEYVIKLTYYRRIKIIKKIILIATVLLASQVAQADFTPIGYSGEPSFTDILDTIYPGSFSPDGLNYQNTTGIYVQRMVDSLSSTVTDIGVNMNVVTGPATGATDQIWDDGATKIYAKARYAGYAQDFGYWTEDDDDGKYDDWHYLFSVNSGYVQTGQASPDLTGLEWAW